VHLEVFLSSCTLKLQKVMISKRKGRGKSSTRRRMRKGVIRMNKRGGRE
jgi:hypothetical protein